MDINGVVRQTCCLTKLENNKNTGDHGQVSESVCL